MRLCVFVLLLGLAGPALASPEVLAVDRVGEPGLGPAADLLSVTLLADREAPLLRVALLSLGRDLTPLGGSGRAATGEPVTLEVSVDDAPLASVELRLAGERYAAADREIRVDGDAVYLPVPREAIARGRAVFTVATSGGDAVRAAWPADRDVSANCALVLHGNQGLGYTDVFHGRGDDLAGSGFDEAMEVHEALGIPVNVHLSGPLQTVADWSHNQGDPLDFNGWLAAGVSAGWVGMLSSAYAQHIMPFVRQEMNDWAVHTETQMVSSRYGYTPTVAWVPERVWLNTSGYPSSGVNDWIGDSWQSHGIGAVILDDDVHLQGHDNHQIHTLSGNGLRLIPRDRSFTGAIIGGNGQAALDILTAMSGSGVGRYRLAVMAEDWEAVAEMGGWADITPNAVETYAWFVDKCSQESAWLATWKLADAVANPDFTGSTITITPGTYWEIGGTDGYGGADNSWYTHWAGWVPYANGGDGNGNCAGQGGNCKNYGALWNDAYDALLAAPDNNLSQAGWYVLMTNLYETGWHDGLGGAISGWQHNYAGHIKQASIYAEAARWAAGEYAATTAAYPSDIDNDGYDELVMHSDRLFAVFEATGGRCTHLFVKGPGYDDTAIGVDNAYWSGTTADYNDANHLGAFSDVGPNYQHQPYSLEVLDGDGADNEVTIRASYQEVSKEISLRTGEPWIEAVYRVGATPHWIQAGWSPSLVDLVWNAQMERVWSPSQAYMGQRNPNTGVTVGWVLGQGGAGHQQELAATLMKGDEVYSHGTFQVRLYAGQTGAPVGGEVSELQAVASTLFDTVGPRVDWATWNPNGQLRVYFDQPIVDGTADVGLMGFDDDGDGVPEIELDGIATVAPVGFVWFIMISVDPAHVDAINALHADDLRLVLEPGAIEDFHGNPNPWTDGPVTVYQQGRVVIDGAFDADEWTDFRLDDAGDSQWTSDNEIEALHVTWDELYLYLGIEGQVHANSWILYLDVNPGSGIGETDLTRIDAWERGAVFTAPGFAADWQYAAYQHQSPYDTQGLWKIESATTTENASANAIMAYDPDHLNGLDGGSELAIAWRDLYGLGDNQVPPGAQISLVASVCWDPEPDGELGGDSAPSNFSAALPTIDNVWTLTVDTDGDGAPDPLGAVAVPEAPASRLALRAPYPNPFNPSTTLSFDVPAGAEGPLTLAVFDARGRRVATLVDRPLPAGRHAVQWRGRDQAGRPVAAGTYFCRLEQAGRVSTRALTLVK
ncbi:MAG: FlgD immunoglobulin-like domain containing protein [Candidatus Krumholzibacteriia bacterium]